MEDALPTFDRSALAECTVEPDQTLSTAALELVAEVSDAQIGDLPLLYERVDADALERAFPRSDTGLIAFPYYGYVVCVTANRTVAIYEQ